LTQRRRRSVFRRRQVERGFAWRRGIVENHAYAALAAPRGANLVPKPPRRRGHLHIARRWRFSGSP
jgi:hypothetical protein